MYLDEVSAILRRQLEQKGRSKQRSVSTSPELRRVSRSRPPSVPPRDLFFRPPLPLIRVSGSGSLSDFGWTPILTRSKGKTRLVGRVKGKEGEQPASSRLRLLDVASPSTISHASPGLRIHPLNLPPPSFLSRPYSKLKLASLELF